MLEFYIVNNEIQWNIEGSFYFILYDVHLFLSGAMFL